MGGLATFFQGIGRTLFRMEIILVVLMVAMTAIGRTTELDTRIRVAVIDTLQRYHADRVIAVLDATDAPQTGAGRTTAALPVSR